MAQFWKDVVVTLSDLVSENISFSVSVLILNDLSSLNVPSYLKRATLVGLTAAKKLVAVRWKPPHQLSKRHWLLTFLDMVNMEISTARINGVKEEKVNNWIAVAETLKSLVNPTFRID